MRIKYSEFDQKIKQWIDYLDFRYCGLIGHKYFNTGVKGVKEGTFIFQCKRCHCTINHTGDSL